MKRSVFEQECPLNCWHMRVERNFTTLGNLQDDLEVNFRHVRM